MSERDRRRPQTDDEAYVQSAQRHYETVATKLEQLAADIRERGARVGSGRSTAVAHAADLMSDFTQGVGGIGSFLWSVVHDAEHLDRQRREAGAAKDQAEDVAAELDRLAKEMDDSPASLAVTAEDVRARAAQLRGEDTWCNCQAIRGTANYPGPWHPKGDSIGCLKFGVSGGSGASGETRP